jgi:hypothetical protein
MKSMGPLPPVASGGLCGGFDKACRGAENDAQSPSLTEFGFLFVNLFSAQQG